MKRLLAYLFLVLGLGLVFSVKAEASIKCYNPYLDTVETWSSYDECPGNRILIKGEITKENISNDGWTAIFIHPKSKNDFISIKNTESEALKRAKLNCLKFVTLKTKKEENSRVKDYASCKLKSIFQPTIKFFVSLLRQGENINTFRNKYNLTVEKIDKIKKTKYELEQKNINKYINTLHQGKTLANQYLEKETLINVRIAKLKHENNNIDKYINILHQGKTLANQYLEKETLINVRIAKLKHENNNINKYINILHQGKTLDNQYLEKETLKKIPEKKLKYEEDNIDKYLQADLKNEDLTKFNLEKETIELVKVKRQERRETLYAKTCTGWVFGHKKGTYEWFKCLDDEEQKELFEGTEIKIVKEDKDKPLKPEKIIITTSTYN